MITDNYIKMCEQAEEIQEVWRNPLRNKFGDLYWRGEKYLMIPEACILNTDSHFIPEKEVYLPTQEQLQEMVKDILFLIQGSFIDLYMSASTGHRDSHIICRKAKSMNELWLMCVMHEKYQKTWTGEKWEEVKEC